MPNGHSAEFEAFCPLVEPVSVCVHDADAALLASAETGGELKRVGGTRELFFLPAVVIPDFAALIARYLCPTHRDCVHDLLISWTLLVTSLGGGTRAPLRRVSRAMGLQTTQTRL